MFTVYMAKITAKSDCQCCFLYTIQTGLLPFVLFYGVLHEREGYFANFFVSINKFGATRAAVIFICLPFETPCSTAWDSINTHAVSFTLFILLPSIQHCTWVSHNSYIVYDELTTLWLLVECDATFSWVWCRCQVEMMLFWSEIFSFHYICLLYSTHMSFILN